MQTQNRQGIVELNAKQAEQVQGGFVPIIIGCLVWAAMMVGVGFFYSHVGVTTERGGLLAGLSPK